MSTNDDFFDRSEFVQYFRDETEEILQRIDSDLLRLERYVDAGTLDVEIVNALFRGLHTVKGSAGMLDFKDVQEVAHKLENLFDLLRKDRMPLSDACINLLFEGRDILTDLVHAAVDSGEVPAGVAQFVARLDAFASVYESTAVAIDGKRAEANADEVEALAPVDNTAVEAFEAEVARLLAAASAPATAVAGAPVIPGTGSPQDSGTALVQKLTRNALVRKLERGLLVAFRDTKGRIIPSDWTVVEWPVTGPYWSVEIKDGQGGTIAARNVPLPLTELEKRLIVRTMFEDAMEGKDKLS